MCHGEETMAIVPQWSDGNPGNWSRFWRGSDHHKWQMDHGPSYSSHSPRFFSTFYMEYPQKWFIRLYHQLLTAPILGFLKMEDIVQKLIQNGSVEKVHQWFPVLSPSKKCSWASREAPCFSKIGYPQNSSKSCSALIEAGDGTRKGCRWKIFWFSRFTMVYCIYYTSPVQQSLSMALKLTWFGFSSVFLTMLHDMLRRFRTYPAVWNIKGTRQTCNPPRLSLQLSDCHWQTVNTSALHDLNSFFPHHSNIPSVLTPLSGCCSSNFFISLPPFYTPKYQNRRQPRSSITHTTAVLLQKLLGYSMWLEWNLQIYHPATSWTMAT